MIFLKNVDVFKLKYERVVFKYYLTFYTKNNRFIIIGLEEGWGLLDMIIIENYLYYYINIVRVPIHNKCYRLNITTEIVL